MAKRGELKPMDAFEEGIRNSAVAYNVVMFQPGVSSRVYQSFAKLQEAIEYSKVVLKEPNRIRSAMIYAIDESEHHALVGTVKRSDCEFKPVVPDRYK
jgi:hypothetical protein